MGGDLPEVVFAAAISEIGRTLVDLPKSRELVARELSPYGGRFKAGWAVSGLCDESSLELWVLVPPTAPFFPPRVAVHPAPPCLIWPHVEEGGLLCLLPDPPNVQVTDPGPLTITLLDSARRLVNASLHGENIQDFEDEFTSYWVRWERTAKSGLVVRSFCEPNGPSRITKGWGSGNSWVVAEDVPSLRQGIANMLGDHAAARAAASFPVPLLWLPRPMRPQEYPKTVRDLRTVAQQLPQPLELLDGALLESEGRQRLFLLGASGRNGAAFAGVMVEVPKGLRDGFRGLPPRQVLLARYDGCAVIPGKVIRLDHGWVHGRDQNLGARQLKSKHIVIAGIGSLGSAVAELLAKAGVGKLTLVDCEALESANSARHVLGAADVDQPKATAVTRNIRSRFPDLCVSSHDVSFADLLRPPVEHVASAHLIISATGSWPAENLLDRVRREGQIPAVLYGWTEPFAAAGHAVLLTGREPCLGCVVDEWGSCRAPVTAWAGDTMLRNPSCGGMFQPYGAVELCHVQALIADLAVDFLLNRTSESVHRVWIGSHDLVIRAGGEWNGAWIAMHGDPGTGSRQLDLPVAPLCEECSAIK